MHSDTRPETVGLDVRRLAAVRPWLESWVDAGRLPGGLVLVARHGRVALLECVGLRDRERGEPVTPDTLFRIYSMTKPVTAVAVMMLYEQGVLELDAPVAIHLPEFERPRVQVRGADGAWTTRPATRPMTVRHLLTHTSGLAYGSREGTPAEALYLERRAEFRPDDGPLAEVVARLATIPLLCEPGEGWHYGVSSDVLGRLVEVVSGLSFARFLAERVFAPLAMADTGFAVPEGGLARLAALYARDGENAMRLLESRSDSVYAGTVSTHSGGGGLVSTVGDYFRFSEMLRRGGELDGARLLREDTVRLMTRNHLPGDIAALGQPRFNETTTEGIGFGLGFSVLLDPARAGLASRAGEYAWGGMASTAFWVDPAADLIVILMTQLVPSDAWPLRRELRALVYAALVE